VRDTAGRGVKWGAGWIAWGAGDGAARDARGDGKGNEWREVLYSAGAITEFSWNAALELWK
jgi:hypothetical protein